MTADVSFADDAHRYRLDRRIAAGAMGEVWRGTDLSLGRPVAVKLLRHEYADDATFRARFEAEARNTGALQHPNIAAVYDVGEANGRPFLVMEYVDGRALSKLLEPGMIARTGPLDPEAVRDLLAQAADGLGAAHRAGIVHRDIKPANLMVSQDRQVKITDFGIARAADGLALTGTGMVMGTPAYLSPEQATGQPSTPASDVYALGCVGYECLAGHRAFEAESPVATALAHVREPVPTLPASAPRDLARVIARAMAKDPADRYPDGAAFAEALRDPSSNPPTATAATVVAPAATQVMSTVPPVTPAAPVPPPLAPEPVTSPHQEPSGRSLLLLLAAFLAVVAIVVAVIVLRGIQDKNGNEPADDRPSTTPSSSPTATSSDSTSPSPSATAPATLDLDEGDYLGRDIADVTADLINLDLRVKPVSVPNPGDQTAGVVTSVDPRHGLHAGDTVTVTYWDDPSPTPTPSDTPTPTPSDTPSPTPTPSDTPSATPSDTPSGSASASPSVTPSQPVVPSRIVGTP